MQYQITLLYKDPRVADRTSTITRDSDDEARDAARRWGRLVCNAAGPNDPKPVAWWLCRLGVDDVFHPFQADPIPEHASR